MDTVWKPNKWIAALLGIIAQPLSMLYVINLRWAVIYLLLLLLTTVFETLLVYHYNFSHLLSALPGIILILVCAGHAWYLASHHSGVLSRSWYSRWYGMLSVAVVFAAGIFVFRACFYEPYRMPSMSMYPGIRQGAFLFVNKYGYGNYRSFGIELMKGELSKPIQRGDLMVFQYPENPAIDYVKRVIGLPGDRLEYRNKQLLINDKYVVLEKLYTAGNFEIYQEKLDNSVFKVAIDNQFPAHDIAVTVPAGHYFVMGDNRDNSRDSRYWGFVPEVYMVGKVVYILNPNTQIK